MLRWLLLLASTSLLIVYLLSLRGGLGWWAVDDPERVIGLAGGALYVYWESEPADLSATEFAALLRDYGDFPVMWLPARSGIGAIVPLWMPSVLLVAVTALLWQPRLRRESR